MIISVFCGIALFAAIRLLLAENNTLFQTLTKNLNNFPRLRNAIRSILMEGTKLAYNVQQDSIAQMEMYGLIKQLKKLESKNSNKVFMKTSDPFGSLYH